MVMVSSGRTLLGLVQMLAPELYGNFQEIERAIGTRHESYRVREVYRRMKPQNFSKGGPGAASARAALLSFGSFGS